MPHITKAPTSEIVDLYKSGYSCEQIGLIYSMSRQAVWERLKRAKIIMRSKKILPFIIYDGIKFTPSEYGYYRATSRDKRVSLHRYKYEKEIGPIPQDCDIHHIDGDRQNNNINNLQCLSKAEHAKLHSTGHNQYINNLTKGITPLWK